HLDRREFRLGRTRCEVVPIYARLPAFAPEALRRVHHSSLASFASGGGKGSPYILQHRRRLGVHEERNVSSREDWKRFAQLRFAHHRKLVDAGGYEKAFEPADAGINERVDRPG